MFICQYPVGVIYESVLLCGEPATRAYVSQASDLILKMCDKHGIAYMKEAPWNRCMTLEEAEVLEVIES
jgi:hypothetical protein